MNEQKLSERIAAVLADEVAPVDGLASPCRVVADSTLTRCQAMAQELEAKPVFKAKSRWQDTVLRLEKSNLLGHEVFTGISASYASTYLGTHHTRPEAEGLLRTLASLLGYPDPTQRPSATEPAPAPDGETGAAQEVANRIWDMACAPSRGGTPPIPADLFTLWRIANRAVADQAALRERAQKAKAAPVEEHRQHRVSSEEACAALAREVTLKAALAEANAKLADNPDTRLLDAVDEWGWSPRFTNGLLHHVQICSGPGTIAPAGNSLRDALYALVGQPDPDAAQEPATGEDEGEKTP